MLLIYLAAGLYLGWTLGGNDAANIFGSAVGSRIMRFRDAAIIGSIFVLLGAVLQGRAAAETLNQLGKVDSMAAAFFICLAAAVVVHFMTYKGLPVSTSQAIVGGIVGWVVFNGMLPDSTVLLKIVSSWLIGPMLGMLFAAGIYKTLKKIILQTRIHAIRLDAWIQFGLVVAGAFGAYGLGANNIANVMGVFVPLAPDILVQFHFFSLDGVHLLFFLGGISIALGIFTLSRKVMETVGNGLLALNAEAAIVVVSAQGLVMFLFSSSTIANALKEAGLPSLPLVPVSSTQLVVGSILGIGIVKGTREINTRLLTGIGLGWLFTPLVTGAVTYLLLMFAANVLKLQVHKDIESVVGKISVDHTPTKVFDLSGPLPNIMIYVVFILFILLVHRTYQKKYFK